MTTKVKICGLKTETALEVALDCGADYVGLVFFPPSPRYVTLAGAAAMAAKARSRAKVVALLVDPDEALIADVLAAAPPDILQLHGQETPERVAEIRSRWGIPVMKAVAVETAEDARAALRFAGAADLILFDARAPEASTRPGGNGAPFDWRLLAGMKGAGPFVLSGGLTPDNGAEALPPTGAGLGQCPSGREGPPGA